MEINVAQWQVVDLDLSESSVRDDEVEIEVGFISDVYDDHNSDDEYIQPRFGGYEYEFVDEVSPNQKCPVCLLPMKDAVQTSECGHRFCRDCLHGILRNDHPVCPNDRQEINEESGFFADKAWARDILSLRVKCQQSARGCDWIGELRHAEDHQAGCSYEDAQCSACQDNVQRRLLETHLIEDCPKRIVECVYCQDEFYFIQKQEHEEMYCRRFPLVCENNCGHDGIPREEMVHHVSEKCPMTVVSCPYANAGCPFQEKRAHLNDYIEASVDDHLEMTWSSLVQTKQELDSMKDLRQEFHKVQEANQKMSDSIAYCRAEVRDLSLAVKNLKAENIQLKKFIEDMTKKTARDIKNLESKVLRHTQMRATAGKEESYYLSSSKLDKPASVSRERASDVNAGKSVQVLESYPYLPKGVNDVINQAKGKRTGTL